MAYTKLAQSILTSTIWMEDDKTRIVWMTLLAMADQNGEVQASIPGLAHIARVSTESCREAIGKFLAPDPDSRTKDDEGRRIEEIRGGWLLINHGHYRDLASNDDQKRKAAERQQRWRDKLKRNASVTDRNANVTQSNTASRPIPHTDTDTDTDTDADITAVAVIPPSEAQPQRIDGPPLADIVNAVDEITGTKSRWTAKRKIALKMRWADEHWRSHWREAAERARESAFLSGRNDRGWVMDLEFFLRPDTVTKILEGKYDDREGFHETSEQKRERANAGVFDRLQAAADRTLARLGSSNADSASEPGAIVFDEASGLPY